MSKTEEFYEAFTYLENHPIFDHELQQRMEVDVVKVDPETMTIDIKDNSKNTLVQVWLECDIISDELPEEFETEYEARHCWDYRLDSGGDTFEDALIELAKNVKKYYPINK